MSLKKVVCFHFSREPGTFTPSQDCVQLEKIYAWLVETTFFQQKKRSSDMLRLCIFQQDVDMAPRLGGSRGSKGKKGGSLEPATAIFLLLMGYSYTPEN